MDDPVAFLNERMDEDEAQLKESASYRGAGCSWPGLHLEPDRARREIAAGRQLLSDYEEAKTSEAETAGVITAILFMQVINRASVYSDHPGYRGEWGQR